MTRKQFNKAFRERLKITRQLRGKSQSNLARNTGLTQDWISHLECGRRLPDAYAFWKLQEHLGGFMQDPSV